MNIARLSVKPEQRRDEQASAGRSRSRSAEAGQALRAARDPPGDEGAGRQQPDAAAPGDERQRLHPGVVGEPGQRPEHAEQRRGRDDDGEARTGGRSGAGIGAMVGRAASRRSRPWQAAGPRRAGAEPRRRPRTRRRLGAVRRLGGGGQLVRRRPARAGVRPRPIEVNGIRISRKTSIETRKPANRNSTPRNLPTWKQLGRRRTGSGCRRQRGDEAPIAMRIVAGTRLWSLPGERAPGSRRAATRRS